MSREIHYEDVTPADRPMCSQFGSGAFPCGPPHKVRVTGGISPYPLATHKTSRRRVMCKLHYEFDKASPRGGSGGFKSRAKNVALLRLAVAHQEQYQELYEAALAELLTAEHVNLSLRDLLGREP